MGSIDDDRSAAEKGTHTSVWVGTDTFMSGWGKCEGSASWAGWACAAENEDAVGEWVKGRSDMCNVKLYTDDSWEYLQEGTGDNIHIYVVGLNHPANDS